jgi:peptidoglycan/LPS O-acetylase OafA/YrhL
MSSRTEAPQAATSSGRGGYFPALDGLRTICFLWVVFGHGYVFHPLTVFAGRMANMGVHVFFALSGFLITTLLLRELSKNRLVDLKAFYVRRALRIFPVYYIALAVALAGMLLLGNRFTQPLGVTTSQLNIPFIAITHGLFVANWFTVPLPTSLMVLWSISVEEQFYVLFPITFARSTRRFAALRPIAIGMLIVFAVRAYVCVRGDVGQISFNTFATGDHLLLGALAAQLVHSWPEQVARFVRPLGTLGEIAAFAVIVLLCTWDRQSTAAWFFEASLSALASASVVLLIAVGDGWLARFFSGRAMRQLGQLTYAAYVFHMYPLAVAWGLTTRMGVGLSVAAPIRTALGAVGALAIAYVVRITFEKRVLAWKRHFERT